MSVMQFCESRKQIISKDYTRKLISVRDINFDISYKDNSYVETNKIKENFKWLNHIIYSFLVTKANKQ